MISPRVAKFNIIQNIKQALNLCLPRSPIAREETCLSLFQTQTMELSERECFKPRQVSIRPSRSAFRHFQVLDSQVTLFY